MTATIPATRADELSELVAVVAATSKDHKEITPGKGLEHYTPRAATPEIDVAMLDGIFRSMKYEVFRNMQHESATNGVSAALYDYHPTLGRADFFRPVPGVITSRFGWREQFHRMHHGVDLGLQIGDTVRAALSGTVERIAYDHDGYGHFMVIRHPDGMETLYGHLEYAVVAQGQFIHAGQPVGIGGNTGNSTGPHLHFEARLGGVAIDPMLLFDFYGTLRWQTEPVDEVEKSVPKGPVYSHQTKSLKKEDTYIVRFGDTPESVARQAGISVMRLQQLNMLSAGAPLQVGRMLKLK